MAVLDKDGVIHFWNKIKAKLDGKANASHNHDDRYYTESEINTKLNGLVSGTMPKLVEEIYFAQSAFETDFHLPNFEIGQFTIMQFATCFDTTGTINVFFPKNSKRTKYFCLMLDEQGGVNGIIDATYTPNKYIYFENELLTRVEYRREMNQSQRVGFGFLICRLPDAI